MSDEFFVEPVFGSEGGAPAPAADEPLAEGLVFPPLEPPGYDQWGLVRAPAEPTLAGEAAGDPTLSILLTFLKAFLTTDAQAQAAWDAVYKAAPAVKNVYAHDPNEVAFNADAMPALYVWRESGQFVREADDWLEDESKLKLLWVFPKALQDNVRSRSPFVNTIAKLVNVGVERGRTPSYVVEGDPDPRAPFEGSLFYIPANFVALTLTAWKTTKLVVLSMDAEKRPIQDPFPALEMSFDLAEKLDYGLGRFPKTKVPRGTHITLLDPRVPGKVRVEGDS